MSELSRDLKHSPDPRPAFGPPAIDRKALAAPHPRLFGGMKAFDRIRANARTPFGSKLAGRLIHNAELIIETPPQEREMVGRRLILACRTVHCRVITLAVAYQVTGEEKYARRAIREVLHAAAYADWNPEHFLDTAEMTMALSVAYDWLQPMLSPSELQILAEAILDKGIRPSFREAHHWINCTNNWNQVCHAGMVAGAIAVAEQDPDLAEQTIRRAIETVPASILESYSPGGAYPEGPMYWGFGTDFCTILIELLQTCFGTDFGLAGIPGFSATGDYIEAMTAPSGRWFNYADCGEIRTVSPAMIWLAQRFQRGDWFATHERFLLEAYASERPATLALDAPRLPYAMLWLDVPPQAGEIPLVYYSGPSAPVPVAMHRSGAGPEDAWLAVKAGSPGVSHGHMDCGSFVFETRGVRFAEDPGWEVYHNIESQGLQLWDGSQNSDRWKILRLGPALHNIPRVEGITQNVTGHGLITAFSPAGSHMDLTGLYTPAAASVTRYCGLTPEGGMEIHDSFADLSPNRRAGWQMCTRAEVRRNADGSLLLTCRNRSVIMRNNLAAAWQITDPEALRQPYESPNTGLKVISFEVPAPPESRLEWQVTLTPVD